MKRIIMAMVSRVGLVYVVVFFILCGVFNQSQVSDDVLNTARPSADYLHFFAYGTKPFDQNEFKRAKAYYLTLIGGNFSTAAMHASLGFCNFYLNDIPGSLKQYKIALSMDARMYAFYYDVGVIKQQQGDYQVAQDMFRKAIYLLPKTKEELLEVLHISDKYRKHNMYQYYYKERLPWDKRMAYIHLFECLIELKEFQGLLIFASDAFKAFPNDPEIYYYASLASYNLGYIKEAMAFILKCMTVAPNFAKAHELKAMYMRLMGDEEAMKQDLLSFKHFQEKDGWKRNNEIQDLHHWDENTLLFQIYR